MALIEDIRNVPVHISRPKHLVFNDIIKAAHKHGLTIEDVDINKPWGWSVRFEPGDAELFVTQFFPGLSLEEAQLGNPDAPLSPKFLLVTPGELLSWQYHDRRAERWAYLTEGGYHRSSSDDQGEMQRATPGDVVQFAQGERHRLVGIDGEHYTLVAEIWQHTHPDNLSDEADITRLEDKYRR